MVVIVLNREVYEIETLYALSNVQCQLYINKAGNKEKKNDCMSPSLNVEVAFL